LNLGRADTRYNERGGGQIMRKTTLAILALLAAGAATIAGPAPAAAYDYPWCIQGGGWGVPGDCSYRSYAECMASASGRRVYCNVNPRVAFGPERRGRPHRYYRYD
jgi:hypothetical protein